MRPVNIELDCGPEPVWYGLCGTQEQPPLPALGSPAGLACSWPGPGEVSSLLQHSHLVWRPACWHTPSSPPLSGLPKQSMHQHADVAPRMCMLVAGGSLELQLDQAETGTLSCMVHCPGLHAGLTLMSSFLSAFATNSKSCLALTYTTEHSWFAVASEARDSMHTCTCGSLMSLSLLPNQHCRNMD